MKKLASYFVAVLVLIVFVQAQAQENKEQPKSPKETVSGTVGGAKTTIVYSRPSARGRKMIGGKDPLGKVWRTGANEATTIEFDKAVKIEGKDLPAGKYALFTIPGETEWTIIFNKTVEQWGAFKYNEAEDALRVKVPVSKPDQFVETLTITPEKDQVSIKWENYAVAFKVQ